MTPVSSNKINTARQLFMQTEREIRASNPSPAVRAIASTLMSFYDVAFLESQKQCTRCHVNIQTAIANALDRIRLKSALSSSQHNITKSDKNNIRELCQSFTESFDDYDTYEVFAQAMTDLYRILDDVIV